jgi:hypothetical protein
MYQHGYLQRRKRDLSREEFVHGWRRHYGVAAACVEYWEPVRGYVQNDVLADALEDVQGFDRSFDAVGEFFYDARAARAAVSHAPRDAIDADADELFEIRPTTHFFGGDVTHLAGRGKAPVKVFLLLARRPDVPFSQFADAVLTASSLATAAHGAGAAVACGDDAHFAFAATLRVWLDSTAAARELLSSLKWRTLLRGLSSVVDDSASLMLLTNENVLQ